MEIVAHPRKEHVETLDVGAKQSTARASVTSAIDESPKQ